MIRRTVTLSLVAASLSLAAPYDLGRTRDLAGAEPISATVALKLRNRAQLIDQLANLYDPRSPQFRRFFSPAEFQGRFAPTPETVQRAAAELQSHGLAVEVVNGSLLRVTGSPASVESAFGVTLHTFQVAGERDAPSYEYHAATSAPVLSETLAPVVEAVTGLDTHPRYRSFLRHAPQSRSLATGAKAGAPATTDAPGLWTVLDFAQYYDVTPLYDEGVSGRSKTIGIVTLASFTPSDAFSYWSSLGLKTSKDRIRVVNVDKGPGKPSDASGSDETTLDVEQSGGIAPGAKIIVYQAPNTDQGFLDAFAKAIDANDADAISCSWGSWEETVDPTQLQAFDNLFLQAASQGQSMSVAAGDQGAYDANGNYPLPQFTKVLSVDHPAADPWILAAGGTTLPGPQQFLLPDGGTFTVDVKNERAWGWDYLDGLCSALGLDPVSCGIFPVGGGGGISSLFNVPFYQEGLGGVHTTAAGQSLVDLSQTPPQTLITLPAHFAGRNVPDVSLNADPDTGYILTYTSDQTGFGTTPFFGGTSFVAPQLAGVSVLLDQQLQGRVGLLSFALYELAQSGIAYSGPQAPLRDIRHGDNEHYHAVEGFDPATGLGSLDVANLARTLNF
jgi:kumamolisin